MRFGLLCGIIMLALSSFFCASVTTKNNNVAKRYTTYGVANLSGAWEKRSFRNTDLFFQHRSVDANIYVTAQCEKLSDSPLEALTAQLLSGMGRYDIISEKRESLGEREALFTEVNVNLDGVTRYLKIMVVRKNRCVYDAVLSAAQSSPEIVKDFDEMAMSFWAEADL